MDRLEETAVSVVTRAKAQGASAADAFIQEDDTFSVTVRMGEVETLKEATSRGLRLRVLIGKRTATSQTSDLTPEMVERLVDETVAMARITSEDDSSGLPAPDTFVSSFPDLDLADASWDALTPLQRIDLARRCEAAAFATDKAVVNSEGGQFDYSRSRTVLANTYGFLGDYEGTYGSIAAVPIAQSEGGMQRDYWAAAARHQNKLQTPEEVGRTAAQRVVRRLGARKVKTCEVPIVFDPLTARSLVGHIFSAVAGDAVYRKSSFLVDQIGESVAASGVTVFDDARMLGGLGSSLFDDEGVPTQTTTIIDAGVLRNYLHSAYTARKLGGRPTGNGSRSGSGSVTVGPTNFYLKPGTVSPEEIIASVDAGLYVVELIGFGVNPVNGDYSRGAVGIWIEKGRLTHPVHEVTIAGNLRQMLRDIVLIGNDVTFLGSVASPTLKIGKMVISGE